MKLRALLLVCGLVFSGRGSGAGTTTRGAHNVQSSSEDATVQLQIEVDAAEPRSLSVGDSVQIRCSVSSDSDPERAKDVRLYLSQSEEGAEVILAETEAASKGISYSLSPVALRHRGLYSCVGDKTRPNLTVKDAHKLIWVNDTSSDVSLELLRVDRVKYFHDKTLTIGCRQPNDNSQWRIMSASEKTGNIAECPNQKRSGDLVSCTVLSYFSDTRKFRESDAYWCESSTEHKSNLFNGTKAEMSELHSRQFYLAEFEIAPAWFVREGDSVVLQCGIRVNMNNIREKVNLQLIWTKMNFENDMTVLLSQRATNPINYTLTNISHEHAGGYTCYHDGQAHVDTIPLDRFIWVQDDSPPVTIDVLSHNRTQFFKNEEITVGCQLPNDHSHWKLKRFDDWTGIVKECETSVLSPSRLLSCTMKTEYTRTKYLFWCDSTTGAKSNVLNVTVTAGINILEAPTLPVMEGDDFTLRCLQRNKTTGTIAPAPAFFWRKWLIKEQGDELVESITVRNVTRGREGLYSCSLEESRESWQTYITVKARPQQEKTTTE